MLTGDDYILPEDKTSVWITVNTLSVYIRRTKDGVVVDLFPLDGERGAALASASARFAEAEKPADATGEAD